MPVQHKARAASGRLHHHQRTSSAGSSRVGLNNLALTQRDAAAVNGLNGNARLPSQTQLKRTGNSAVELNHAGRTTSPYPRNNGHHNNGTQRVASRERITTQKRSTTPLSNKQRAASAAHAQLQTHRADFSVARSDGTDEEDEGDDDAWVSSESGAATPLRFDDGYRHDVGAGEVEEALQQEQMRVGEVTPLHHPHIEGTAGVTAGKQLINNYGNGNLYVEPDIAHATGTTSRSDFSMARNEAARPPLSTSSTQTTLHGQEQGQDPTRALTPTPTYAPAVHVQPQSTPSTPPAPSELGLETEAALHLRQTRSEAPSPTRLRPSHAKRQSLARNSSHGEPSSVQMPHHPLIRGQSFHGVGGLKVKPAPLTLHSESTQALTQGQLSTSPTGSTLTGPGSPTSTYLTRSLTMQSPTSEDTDRRPTRKGSVSSLHSIATLPAPNRARIPPGRSRQPDRTRTLSTLSNSSSSAALTSLNLNMLPGLTASLSMSGSSRPSTPPLTVHFPSESRKEVTHDGYHQLLPPPFLAAHLTVSAHYNPLYDCYERVMRAKQGR